MLEKLRPYPILLGQFESFYNTLNSIKTGVKGRVSHYAHALFNCALHHNASDEQVRQPHDQIMDESEWTKLVNNDAGLRSLFKLPHQESVENAFSDPELFFSSAQKNLCN